MIELLFPIPIMFVSLLSVDLSLYVISFRAGAINHRHEGRIRSLRLLYLVCICYDTANELIVAVAIERNSITGLWEEE